ncbi:MAG: AAA family ATPase [Candidatus Lokiarchaeota archaeon]|nr:AAA family ATPase [Candidatus Lokiarchaeota archaeon]
MMTIYKLLGIDKHQIIKLHKTYDHSVIIKNDQNVLASGAKNFDETIGGGFYRGKKYLIFGANKTGKTQLCHQLCVQAFIQFSKSTKNSEINNKQFVFYFDTENTFRPERIKELIGTYNVEINKMLKNILVSKIMSNSAFLLSLNELENLLGKNSINVLIIDSINNYYNSDLANRNVTNKKAKEIFLKILTKINELSSYHNLIIVATAQVTSNFNRKTPLKVLPIGNHILNHFFSEYIYLDYKEHDKRYVQLVNSLNLPEKRLLYKITSSGIQDHKI